MVGGVWAVLCLDTVHFPYSVPKMERMGLSWVNKLTGFI